MHIFIVYAPPKLAYTPHGMDGDIEEQILYHINHGMLYFAGLEPVEPFIAWTPSRNEQARKRHHQPMPSRPSEIACVD